MLKNRTHRLGVALSCLMAVVACAACSDDEGEDNGGSADGTGGTAASGGTGTGSGPSGGGTTGAGTGSGTGSGTSGGGVDISTPDGNPFSNATLFVDPTYSAKVQSSIDQTDDASLRGKMETVKLTSTAFWLDRIAAVDGLAAHLDAAAAQQAQEGKPVVSVIVVYDLPNRDCNALASNGELRASEGGVDRYKTEFVGRIAEIFRAHSEQRIVAIIEPDSLPNIATNLSNPRCVEAEPIYRELTAHTIKTLAMPHVYQYLDTAHSGWLGWTSNQAKIATIFKEVLDAAGGTGLIRGFATNVSNYTPLHEGPELFDFQGNPCHDETAYASQLAQSFAAAGITNKAFIIDSSRNGKTGIRREWGYWCNVIGAGLGERPRASPAPGIDAYYWIKPPGDSDGTADRSAARFDPMCGIQGAAPGAPEAGQWFHSFFVELVRNANPAL
jgi:cellulose 1,4-beta-cellobiosidase